MRLINFGKPFLTIVTATYNAENYIQKTVESIRAQEYKNFEWIIIDGGSTDSTLKIIEKNLDIVSFYVSQPDQGIYDAWNKGILHARGEWISFLGAGDVYYPNAVFSYLQAAENCHPPVELITSRIKLVDDLGNCKRILGQRYEWKKFQRKMNIAHVGALHHKSLFKKYGLFDCTYRFAADYEFFFRAGSNLKTTFLEEVTADMILGGVSGGYDTLHEAYQIQKKYGSNFGAIRRYILAIFKKIIRPLVWGY